MTETKPKVSDRDAVTRVAKVLLAVASFAATLVGWAALASRSAAPAATTASRLPPPAATGTVPRASTVASAAKRARRVPVTVTRSSR